MLPLVEFKVIAGWYHAITTIILAILIISMFFCNASNIKMPFLPLSPVMVCVVLSPFVITFAISLWIIFGKQQDI